jgi:hypothetical protein
MQQILRPCGGKYSSRLRTAYFKLIGCREVGAAAVTVL